MKLLFGFLITTLIYSCWAAPQQTASTVSTDDLINKIFGYANTKQRKITDPNCTCVPLHLCNNGKINRLGVGIINIRAAGECAHYLEVCCSTSDTLSTPLPLSITPNYHVTRKGCGHRNVDGVGFRIGSDVNEAQFGEFPWMVIILKHSLHYVCGGALIHPSVVLTAGHCVKGKQASTLKIRAGDWDTQTQNEVLPHQELNVSEVLIHENYHAGSLRNDFALLRLNQAVDMKLDNVGLVCLPDPDVEFDKQRCIATGWGKDAFDKKGLSQSILKRIELPIVQRNTCEAAVRTARSLPQTFQLDRSFVCAGGEPSKDTCTGDGGSPLVCPVANDPDRYYQAGIVSWGIGCGQDRVPGVYANVAVARRWIDEKMAKWGLSTSEYVYT